MQHRRALPFAALLALVAPALTLAATPASAASSTATLLSPTPGFSAPAGPYPIPVHVRTDGDYPGAYGVDLIVDGNLAASMNEDGPGSGTGTDYWSLAWDAHSYLGSHTLVLRTHDSVGDTYDTNAGTFTITPALAYAQASLSAPADGTTAYDQSAISITATVPLGSTTATQVQVTDNGVTSTALTSQGGTTWVGTLPIAHPGEQDITVTTTDDHGTHEQTQAVINVLDHTTAKFGFPGQGTHFKTGSRHRLTGRVTPGVRRLLIQRRTGHKTWSTVTTAVPTQSGAFAVSLNVLPGPTQRLLRAFVPAQGGYLPSTSSPLTIHVT